MPNNKEHKRRKPNRGLACFSCGGVIIDVSSTTRRLSRFVRDGEPQQLIHAPARCRNKKCGNEWNSRHPIAIEASREADKRKVSIVTVVAGKIKPRLADNEIPEVSTGAFVERVITNARKVG